MNRNRVLCLSHLAICYQNCSLSKDLPHKWSKRVILALKEQVCCIDKWINGIHTLQRAVRKQLSLNKERVLLSMWRYRHCLSNGWKVYKKTANFVLWLLNWSSTLLEPGFFGNFAVVTTIFFTYCYRKGTLFNLIEDTIKSKYTGAFNKNSMRRTFKAK